MKPFAETSYQGAFLKWNIVLYCSATQVVLFSGIMTAIRYCTIGAGTVGIVSAGTFETIGANDLCSQLYCSSNPR